MIFPTETYLIRVQIIGQQTTSAVCFQRQLKKMVGTLTYLIGLSQQIG